MTVILILAFSFFFIIWTWRFCDVFILCFSQLQLLFLLVFILSQIWPGALLGRLEGPFERASSSWELPCFLAWQDVPVSSCPCFDLYVDEAISPRIPGSFQWRVVFRDHTLGARNTYLHHLSVASRPFQWKDQGDTYFFCGGRKKSMSFYCLRFRFGLTGFRFNFFDFEKNFSSIESRVL